MKTIQKKRWKKLICVLIGISLFLNGIPLYTKAEGADEKGRAVQWLAEKADERKEWIDSGLPNLTCNAMAVLREEGVDIESNYLRGWEKENTKKNVDELAHLAWAWNDRSYMDAIWECQNEDGGFGLTADYSSDVYDTLLVLLAEAALRQDSDLREEETDGQTGNGDAVQAAVDYLSRQQRENGGFGYTGTDTARPGLSAEIGMALLSLGTGDSSFYENLDEYCLSAFTADFSENTFLEQTELARYLYKREKIENPDTVEQQLCDIQKEDGSIYGDAGDTIQYILLVGEIEAYHALKFKVDSLVTEADTYVLETDKEQQVSLQTAVRYAVNQEMPGTIRYTLFENGEVLKTEEKECAFVPGRTEEMVDAAMDVTASEEKEYVLRTELVSQKEDGEETIWKSTEFSFTVHKTEEQEFVLQAETSQEENYGVNLSWNDISDRDNRYSYRVFRKKGNGDWETRSTWDGEEKVKVLNIYPCDKAKDYLVDWMEETISDSEEPAGKGLFDIKTVYIDDYNREPDDYLKDEDGNYMYDVLVFGTYDSNAYKDLSETSFLATQDFIHSGGGVLFGHDTLTIDYRLTHPVFSRFEEQMGIKLINDGNANSCNKVKVVNSGFLTSYPWKLSGILTIPYAHSLGQYTGGTTAATVWMEFQNACLTDRITGAKNNAYLFTNNSLAMIQTGHSNGQATDDERKVLANTLFYLKQLTNRTQTSDKSFYDEAAPEVTAVSDMSAEHQVTIQAEDKGTLYQYYVEGVNANSIRENIQSNTVEAEAFSGIKGFVVGTSDSEESVEGLLTYDEAGNLTSEVLPAVDGALQYTMEDSQTGQGTYLHIYAVDYAGNVSEEMVQQVTAEKAEKEYFNSPYALFATEGEAVLNCCEAKINGDIYGNTAFRFQGTTLLLDGKASTAGTLSLAGGRMELAEQEEGIKPLTLPNYTERILADIEAENETVEELNAYNSTEITIPTICKSTTGVWCGDVRIGASLISDKAVNLNANTISCGADEQVVLCSQNGDINIQATKFNGSGLIYAPNGTVTINVSEWNYTGTIIAGKIKIQAGYVNLNQ